MFTLLPSLYFLGVQCFQRWNASYSSPPPPPPPPTLVEEIPIEKLPVRKVKTRRKKHFRQRKTSLSALSREHILYLMKETGFTEEDIISWYMDFLRDCPDGRLSKSKFIEIYQQFYQKGKVTKFCEHAFRLFNKDGSGDLDFFEFLIAVSLTSSKDATQKIDLFFSMYDRDQNGLIDINEMRDFLESLYELMGIDISDPSRIDSKVQKIFANAQCDQLGYLTKDQFILACETDRYIRKLLVSNSRLQH